MAAVAKLRLVHLAPPKAKLNPRNAATLACVNGKRTTYPDSGCNGLELRVYPTGRRVFSFRYSDGRGADRRYTMGALSTAFTLKHARIMANALRTKVDQKVDPQVEKQVAAAAYKTRGIHTVSDLFTFYLEHPKVKARLRPSTYENYRYRLRQYVEPKLGTLPFDAPLRPRLSDLVEEIGTDRPITANRVLTVVSAVYTFAVKNHLNVYNPATGIDHFPETPRSQHLSNPQLFELWAGLSDPDRPPGPELSIAIKLALLTMQRASEVLGMRDDELDLSDPDYPLWEIPAHRMKSGRIHIVPLAPQALELIRQAQALRAARVNRPLPVFPSVKCMDEAMTRHAMTRGFKRLCAEIGIEKVTVHDLRRTGRTRLTREGINAGYETAERVIDHLVGSAVSRVYDRNDYLPEKRKALSLWASYLYRIVVPADGGVRKTNYESPTK